MLNAEFPPIERGYILMHIFSSHPTTKHKYTVYLNTNGNPIPLLRFVWWSLSFSLSFSRSLSLYFSCICVLFNDKILGKYYLNFIQYKCISR